MVPAVSSISCVIRLRSLWFRSETSFDHDPGSTTISGVANQLRKGNHTPVRPPRDAVGLAVDVLSDRWTFLILREAFFGVRRYGQMQRNLGIARNVLADRLRQLVSDGMFERVRYRTDPDWYEYRLTDRALDLYPAIVALMRWADRHLAEETGVPPIELIHRSCG